jgi:hypothetical protein
MRIFYIQSDRTPSEGDVKLIGGGRRFVRRRVLGPGGCPAVSGGRPVFDWCLDPCARIPDTCQAVRRPRKCVGASAVTRKSADMEITSQGASGMPIQQ